MNDPTTRRLLPDGTTLDLFEDEVLVTQHGVAVRLDRSYLAALTEWCAPVTTPDPRDAMYYLTIPVRDVEMAEHLLAGLVRGEALNGDYKIAGVDLNPKVSHHHLTLVPADMVEQLTPPTQ